MIAFESVLPSWDFLSQISHQVVSDHEPVASSDEPKFIVFLRLTTCLIITCNWSDVASDRLTIFSASVTLYTRMRKSARAPPPPRYRYPVCWHCVRRLTLGNSSGCCGGAQIVHVPFLVIIKNWRFRLRRAYEREDAKIKQKKITKSQPEDKRAHASRLEKWSRKVK